MDGFGGCFVVSGFCFDIDCELPVDLVANTRVVWHYVYTFSCTSNTTRCQTYALNLLAGLQDR
jgi:hypothetical protein